MALELGGHGRGRIEVSPMIDVMLALLIIFLIIVPSTHRELPVRMPMDPGCTLLPPGSMVGCTMMLSMDRDGQMFIEKEQIRAEDFAFRLGQAMQGRESKMVFFTADGSLPYGQMMDFLDLCRRSGAQNIGLVLNDL